MNRFQVEAIILDAIGSNKILDVRYRHTSDGGVVEHRIAPFDIGSTNPKTAQSVKDNVYAFSYTHVDDKTGRSDPKVCAFNIESFLDIQDSGSVFDESNLADLHLSATKYDYRRCRFNMLPDRAWF